MNAVLFAREAIQPDGRVRLTGEAVKHIRAVLKKGAGDVILAGCLDGALGPVRILAEDRDALFLEMPSGAPPPLPPVDLILAMPRPKVMKRLWAPLASMGVRRLAIIGAAKVERFYFDSHALDENERQTRLVEGLAQARDTRMPEVSVIPSFSWFMARHAALWAAEGVALLAQPGAALRVAEAFHQKGATATRAVLAIGPEGGWTDEERAAWHTAGFMEVGLGARAFRTDVAVIALLALAYDALAATPT